MNLRRNQAKYLFAFWLCLFSLIDFQSLQGLVVCFGSDGHVAVETSLDGNHCKSLIDLSTPIRMEEHSHAAHCGECRDIHFDSSSLRSSLSSRSTSVPKRIAPILGFLNGNEILCRQAIIARTFPPIVHSIEFALLPIRTTVLRI